MAPPMPDEEISLGEVGRSVIRIERQLEALTNEVRQELRDVRHKANNALQAAELQSVRNEKFANDIERVAKSDERQWEAIDHLKENAASQEAVDKFRKWLIGTVVIAGGIGVMNLLVSVSNGP
jgi:hypothetical protein